MIIAGIYKFANDLHEESCPALTADDAAAQQVRG